MNHDNIDYQLSNDQNFLTIEGEQYQAFDAISKENLCANCALYTEKVNSKCDISLARGFCFSNVRKDKRAIVWVEKYEN